MSGEKQIRDRVPEIWTRSLISQQPEGSLTLQVVLQSVRVLGQRGDLDVHVLEHGESAEDSLQLIVIIDFEDGVVGVLAHHTPDSFMIPRDCRSPE